MHNREHDTLDTINYLLLLATIIIGVAAGNLLSNAITAAWIAHKTEQALIEIAKQVDAEAKASMDALQSRLDEQSRLAYRAQAEQEQRTKDGRKKSKTAQELLSKCRQWRQAYSDTNTVTAKEQADKHCTAYDTFVETGRYSNHEYRTNVVPGR